MIRAALAVLVLAPQGAPQGAQQAAPGETPASATERLLIDAPLTVAESSGWRRTSRSDEVLDFVRRLEALPHAGRLGSSVIGRSELGRGIVAVTARLESDVVRPSVLVNANIHGGEVEGKTAVQMILREIASGEHADILSAFDLVFVPVFNVDGNDRIDRRNRVSQNGPDGGVGRRENADGLDLNRDFVKAETSEVRALLGLVARIDPLVFFDLHTTNGSPHGYDLTYATSLSPNAGPALDAFARERLFPGVRAKLAEERGIHVFDYGNFEYAPRARGSRGERGDPERWATYDARPRFGTNLMGLRGTLPILSEAFSYLPHERRVEATHAFVLECLRFVARERAALLRAQAADRAVEPSALRLLVDARLEDGTREPVRVSAWENVTVDVDPRTPGVQEGTRRVAPPTSGAREVPMLVQRAFVGGRAVEVGAGFAIAEPSDAVLTALGLHLGDAVQRLAAPARVAVDVFVVEGATRAERPFQGHNEVALTGTWEERTVELPAGALVVPATRLSAHLLHPESDDSLTTWNVFDAALFDADETGERVHPVLRLRAGLRGIPTGR